MWELGCAYAYYSTIHKRVHHCPFVALADGASVAGAVGRGATRDDRTVDRSWTEAGTKRSITLNT